MYFAGLCASLPVRVFGLPGEALHLLQPGGDQVLQEIRDKCQKRISGLAAGC